MAIAHLIRDIGRGKEGTRSLSEAQAHELMSLVLDGRASDLEVGAFSIAMRLKGETIDELAGFVKAAHARSLRIPAARPTVVLPSYNGARKLPNLTALLALLLAQEGIDVLVHGTASDEGRVGTATIFHHLGLPVARDAADVADAWARREPVFMAIDDLCPPLARLLAVRQVIGLRNSGHTVAKLLMPCDGDRVIQVVNYTHPEYASLQSRFLEHAGARALSIRGTEGEPVVDARRTPKLEVYVDGRPRPELGADGDDAATVGIALLPAQRDAVTTAHYIQSVVSGEKPAPAPLLAQVECLSRSLRALTPLIGTGTGTGTDGKQAAARG